VAEASIESGASVILSSSSPDRVKSSIEALQESYPGSKVTGYACDLSKPSLEQDVEELFKKTGHLDHIVFTAGDPLAAIPIQEITLEKILKAGQVRFFAPLLVAKVGSRYLNKTPESSIVLTSGTVAEKPLPNMSAVAGFGSGLQGMTRNLALDLKPIRVNLVLPGAVDTPLWGHLSEENRSNFEKSFAETSVTGVMGRPEQVAEAYLWLLKDSNATGVIATSDSGSLIA